MQENHAVHYRRRPRTSNTSLVVKNKVYTNANLLTLIGETLPIRQTEAPIFKSYQKFRIRSPSSGGSSEESRRELVFARAEEEGKSTKNKQQIGRARLLSEETDLGLHRHHVALERIQQATEVAEFSRLFAAQVAISLPTVHSNKRGENNSGSSTRKGASGDSLACLELIDADGIYKEFYESHWESLKQKKWRAVEEN